MSKLEAKIDGIATDIGQIKITCAEQHVTLQEHIRRTEILENEMKPVKRHVNMIDGALKLIGILGILAAIVSAVMMVIK